ncbi:nucleoside diphosphate kinase regulator [Cellvibrio sp. NN19]|uniref:nucleoside diphosphate kinase regulator n=1 Tax=Cellvibrio chitinivorans TaxID=3102792 RepID=UPI002B412B0A|nr:nucleoside diphosphate kinase regulator [Cellvibrio sp. NN19]
MRAKKANSLLISTADYQQLIKLIERYDTPAADALDEELGRPDLVKTQETPIDAVSMGSTVTFIDLDSNEENTVSLVYPEEANVAEMKISVLSPVGSALIGLRVGGEIDWPVPQGKVRRLKVTGVQPPQ